MIGASEELKIFNAGIKGIQINPHFSIVSFETDYFLSSLDFDFDNEIRGIMNSIGMKNHERFRIL